MSVGTAEFRRRLEAIMSSTRYSWGTMDEARNCLAHIRLTQQELRALKADIKLHMQGIRHAYTVKRANVWALFFDKHKARTRANERRRLTAIEHNDLMPYEELARDADLSVHELERIRLQINQWVTANKPAGRR